MSGSEGPRISICSSVAGRSPSRESLRTEASFMSSLTCEVARLRHPSPAPAAGARLRVPAAAGGAASGDVWWEDEADLLRSCGLLSRMLGMSKSFSTGDIALLPEEAEPARRCVSLVTLTAARPADVSHPRLDQASRSCSTWVACGDLASTSQLPSPQGRQHPAGQSPFSAVDLIKAVNKKVRQNYIRRRLQITFRALHRLSQSQINLEQLFSSGGLPALAGLSACGEGATHSSSCSVPPVRPSCAAAKPEKAPPAATPAAPASTGITVRDVDRQRGRPLTRYQRNMMVFNWLHTLEEPPLEVT